MTLTAIVDIDGTLVDSNYLHALAWQRALREHGAHVPAWRIHRHVGMGGDQIVTALTDDDFEREYGDEVRERESDLFAEVMSEVEPLPGARDLLARLSEAGETVVLASSARAEEVDHYIEVLGANDVADGWTTSADVDSTKPEPDLIHAALERVDGSSENAVMIGDTTWDCKAASRAGVRSIGVLSGGFSQEELVEAGAEQVFVDARELLARIDETPFGSQISD